MSLDRDSSSRAWLVLACTCDGTIVRVMHDELGVARHTSAAPRFADIVDAGSKRKAIALIEKVAGSGCVVGWQLNVPVSDGARPFHFAGARSGESLILFGAPGSPTHENDIYDELSRLNNDLINREREVARNGAALQRVSAEKSRLMAIAAHDLRNPLTIIASYADLLRFDGKLSEEQVSHIDEISRSAHFMMELVEEMLDSARFESGHVDVELKKLDLVEAARHSAKVNRLRAERKEIAVMFEQKTDQAIIRADAVKLRQIINNLVVNAIKFSPSRTAVTIRVRSEADRAVIEVEDRGIGIAPEKITTIFEPFRTLSASGTAGEKSTGLGLSIVKQLAELHNATVDVQSEEGRGSIFRVAFPLAG